MKKLFRFLAVSLSAAFIVTAAACGGNNDNSESEEPATAITETENYLVKDGLSDYAIVYPENGDSRINLAVSELTRFFEQATGITLPAYNDRASEAVWRKSSSHFISLGETRALVASGAGDEIDRKDLKTTGYAIKNEGYSVFLIGGDTAGTLFAVYRFLHEQFNFECYAADEIVLDSDVTDEKLLNYNGLKDIPDITYHATAQTELQLNPLYGWRIGQVPQDEWIVELGGAYYHNFFGTIPAAQYQSAHPDWFAPAGNQLCLSRDMEGLAAEVGNKIKEVIRSNPTGKAIGFTQQDDGGWCGCSKCKEIAAQYGADSAVQILFMNYLWRNEVEPFLEANYPDREIYLYMFAYHSTELPPQANADGTMPEEMILDDHIYVQFAPIYAAGYHSYDETINSDTDARLQNWKKVTNNFMMWTYSFYYKGMTGIFPYFDFYDMKDTFVYLKNNGIDYLFDEDHSGGAKRWSDWSRLKFYLRSKLARHTETDLLKATDSFFENYFKVAAPTMRQIFDEYSSVYCGIISKYNLTGRGNAGDTEIANKTEYWPKEVLNRWLRMFDKAYEEIEYLKESDYSLWFKLEERIRLESITFRYLCESLYGEGSSDYVGNGNSVLDDCRYFGITYLG